MNRIPCSLRWLLPFCCSAPLLIGCAGPQVTQPSPGFYPNEDAPVSLSEYIVNPPDILFIEMEPVPSPDSVINVGDTLQVVVPKELPDHPIPPALAVDVDGMIEFPEYYAPKDPEEEAKLEGLEYDGSRLKVEGMTVAQCRAAIQKYLVALDEPDARVMLTSVTPISGSYNIRPDGRISLGFYGEVYLAGQTLAQTAETIKEHLVKNHGVANPKLVVDVANYNSMFYYIISDGAGFGDGISKYPVIGHETVLDAFTAIGGLPQTGSKTNIWIARPIQGDPDSAEILPIDWVAISKHGSMATNYQMLAGDRLYIKADKFTATDNLIAKIVAPINQALGVGTLFNITVNQFSSRGSGFNNNN